MGEEKKDWAEEAAGKLLTAAAVVAGVYALFQLFVRGVFSLMMGGNPDNAIYVLFYGGIVVVAGIFLFGAGSGWLLWRGTRAKPAPGEKPSMIIRGILIGLAVVAAVAVILLVIIIRAFSH